MKQIIFIISVSFFCCGMAQGQKTNQQSKCDSMETAYKHLEKRADSLIANNENLSVAIKNLGLKINAYKKYVQDLVKNDSEVLAKLNESKKMIAAQATMIDKLEEEVKRLSPPKQQ